MSSEYNIYYYLRCDFEYIWILKFNLVFKLTLKSELLISFISLMNKIYKLVKNKNEFNFVC